MNPIRALAAIACMCSVQQVLADSAPDPAGYDRNAVFLSRRFLTDAGSIPALTGDFLPRAQQRFNTPLLIPNGGLLKADGTLDHPSAGTLRFLEQVRSFEAVNGARYAVMPYINGYSLQNAGRDPAQRIDLGNPAVRANVIAECMKYLSADVPGSYVKGSQRVFDGVVLDIEPAGDPALLASLKTLLIELRQALREAGLARAKIGLAAPQFTERVPKPDWAWNASDYYYMAKYLDYLFAMTYDAGAGSVASYRQWLTAQTTHILKAVSGAAWHFDAVHPAPANGVAVLLGLPAFYAVTRAHNPEIENVANGAPAIRAGLRQLSAQNRVELRYFQGAFLYVHDGGAANSAYARDNRDWQWWTEFWLARGDEATGRSPQTTGRSAEATGRSAQTTGRTAQVTGTVGYDEPLSLPSGALVQVVLEDVTLADAAAVPLAAATIRSAEHAPIPFALSYDPASVAPDHDYAIRASIIDADGHLLWTNGARYSVVTGGHPSEVAVAVQSTREFSFSCDGVSVAARMVDKGVQIGVRGRYFMLPQREPAPAPEYADGSTRLQWRRSDEALFELDGRTYHCRRAAD